VTMSSIEDCNVVIENLDGKVRSSLSLSLSRCVCICLPVINMLY
jgi:hypothetical protein